MEEEHYLPQHVEDSPDEELQRRRRFMYAGPLQVQYLGEEQVGGNATEKQLASEDDGLSSSETTSEGEDAEGEWGVESEMVVLPRHLNRLHTKFYWSQTLGDLQDELAKPGITLEER